MSAMSMESDLSLGRDPPTISQTLSYLRAATKSQESDNHGNYFCVMDFYLKALEDERSKIEAFKRELPLCIQLLDDAIASLRDKLKSNSMAYKNDTTESLVGPEELMLFCKKREKEDEAIKHAATWFEESRKQLGGEAVWKEHDLLGHWNAKSQKSDSSTSPSIREEATRDSNQQSIVEAMDPSFSKASKSRPPPCIEISELAQMKGVLKGSLNQPQRKPRRCWSPELHQCFLNALNQLGGSQVATPKQIREIMNVEGLTNDEVKSHLQKFRLHMRRPSPVAQAEATQQSTHLVVFGGIWVPPEYGNHASLLGQHPQTIATQSNLPPHQALLHQDFFHPLSPSQMDTGSTTANGCHVNMINQARLRYVEFEDEDRRNRSSEEAAGRPESSSLICRRHLNDPHEKDLTSHIHASYSRPTSADFKGLLRPPLHLSCGLFACQGREEDQELHPEKKGLQSRSSGERQGACN